MTRYRIVPERSRVWIEARSNVHPIHSSTDGLDGHVELELDEHGRVDSSVKPSARVSLPVARLSSGNRLEERELKKRIDAKRFPVIDGLLDTIAGGEDGHYQVSGDVTFRGVTRRHEDLMTVEKVDASTIQLAGSSRFDIRDFGMEPPRILVLRVEPEVDVRVEILAVQEG
ncbi:MAG: YceI family protein [Acidimicrobiales bacterium]